VAFQLLTKREPSEYCQEASQLFSGVLLLLIMFMEAVNPSLQSLLISYSHSAALILIVANEISRQIIARELACFIAFPLL